MRLTTLTVLVSGFVAACFGDTGGSRKPGTGSAADKPGGASCARVDKDVTIRSARDMKQLPRSGCYDLHGTLVVQGQAITSLADLGEISSVDELDLDRTAIVAVDTRRTLGIYGKLTVTGNSKLASLRQLAFQAEATGISSNQNLLICRAIEIDACVPHPFAAVIANNNDLACNWQCE